jgi:hypothetical protein
MPFRLPAKNSRKSAVKGDEDWPRRSHRVARVTVLPAMSRLAARAQSLPLRVVSAVILVLAVATGIATAATTVGGAGAAPPPTATCHEAGYEQIDDACLKITRTGALSSTASAALEKAFSVPAGRAAMEKLFAKFDGSTVGLVQAPSISLDAFVRPDWNCPGGASCGVSSSGGRHFWVIVSYASIYNVGAFPFWLACTGALSPIIDPLAATAACGAVTGLIWALVNNASYTTQHGVWLAIYPNYWTDGLW